MVRSGRPTKLSPALQARVCKAILAGCYVETACEIAGVSRATLYRWLAAADGGDSRYEDFRDAIKKARAEAEAKAIASILRAGKKSWVATAWYLERSFPARWRRRTTREDIVPDEVSAEDFAPSTGHEPTLGEQLEAAFDDDPSQIERGVKALRTLDEIAERRLTNDGGESGTYRAG
jgi:transposase